MSHFHVLLAFQDAPDKLKCVFVDLSEKDLNDKFLRHYRSGRGFLCDNEVMQSSRIRSVRIIRTDRMSEDELKAIQEKSWKEIDKFNRESPSMVLISVGRGYDPEDIVETGSDVTSSYVLGPPGSGDRWQPIAGILNHPWISTIGTGIVVAAIVAWLGWN